MPPVRPDDRERQDPPGDGIPAPELYALDELTPPPRRRLRVRSAPRKWTVVLAAVAFFGGVLANAAVFHFGHNSPATKVVIGQRVIRPTPTTVSRGHSPSTSLSRVSMAWATPTSVDPQYSLESVSCTSSAFCAAGDSHGQVVLYQAGHWGSPEDVDGATQINSVSCVGTSFCVAVDQAGEATVFDGTGWSHPQRIAGRDTFGELTSVSCSSPSFCAAVDGDGNGFVYDGRTWSAPQQVDPPGWTPTSRDLAQVSCPQDGFCAGVDPEGEVFYYVGGSWQSAESIDPAAPSQPTKYANAVSCADSTFCTAAQNLGEVVSYNGTQWSAPIAIDPDDYIEAVSCPTALFCVAVDGLLPDGFSAGSGSGQVMLYDGVHWSTPASIDGEAVIRSVSCPTAQFCMAVDQSGQAVAGAATVPPSGRVRSGT